MRIAFITVGDPARLTGGYLYHREVFARLRARGVVVDELVAAEAGLEEQLAAAASFGERLDPAPYAALVVDALARAVCAPWLDTWRARRPLVAMVHELPSVAGPAETERELRGAGGGPGPAETEREAALLRADRLIAVSDDGARLLAERGVPCERIEVASGGLDRLTPGGGRAGAGPGVAAAASGGLGRLTEDATAGPRSSPPASVLCVAQWIPRKGVLELARAWARAARPGWRLELVGEVQADPPYAAAVRAALAAVPAGSALVRGAISDHALAAAYSSAALFALPARYEGYGIAFAEALAHALPVVGCAVGPVPALVGPEAGLLVPPGDEGALAAALARLIDDGALRERMASAALARARALPTWDQCADRFLGAVEAAIAARGASKSGPSSL